MSAIAEETRALKIDGTTLKSEFTAATAEYVLEYKSEPSAEPAPTEIYVPYVHYPGGFRVTASDGHCKIEKHEAERYDIVKHEHDAHAHTHRIVVAPTKPAKPEPSSWLAFLNHSNLPVYAALLLAVASPLVISRK